MYTIDNMSDELKAYFNWSANALVPFYSKAADLWLMKHKEVVIEVAQQLLELIDYKPTELYRGVILREHVDTIEPHPNFTYLSFSESKEIACHFADINGFGSDIVDVRAQLGDHCYVITYTPEISEVLYHHAFLTLLPYAEVFTRIGMNGLAEVQGLARQKEVTILQPDKPFTTIEKQRRETYEKYKHFGHPMYPNDFPGVYKTNDGIEPDQPGTE